MHELTTFRFPTEIRFGAGSRAALAELASQHDVERPLLVTDGGMVATDAYRLVAIELDRLWPDAWRRYDGIRENPSAPEVEVGLQHYLDGKCDAVIGFGGGSAIDGAKALLLKIAAPETALEAIDLGTLPELIAPFCAIPTTAGTGSEVGRSTVVTIPALGRKVVLGAPALLPRIALLDPELTIGLPPLLTAATGMDAMTHAIEAFVCPVFHPMCDGIALEAIYRIRRFLRRAVEHGGDLEARGELLVAAAMGAVAFQKDLGAAHSLAHPLSTEFGLNHGLANAVVLPAVIRFNGEADSDQYARVAQALGLALDGYRSDPAKAVADEIEALEREIALPPRLRGLNVPEESLPMLADKAFEDGCHLSNPRPCTRDDLLRLYREAW